MGIKLNKESLENAFSGNDKLKTVKKSDKTDNNKSSFKDKNEEIGFHKGSLNTLAAERVELIKMIQNVEAILQAHLKRLEELGVKLQKEESK